MRSRLLAFFIALVLSLPGVLSPSVATAAGSAAAQESGISAESDLSASVLDPRSVEVPAAGHGEVLLDFPELLNAHNAPADCGEAISRLRPLAVTVSLPPFLEGPQRPPRAAGLLA